MSLLAIITSVPPSLVASCWLSPRYPSLALSFHTLKTHTHLGVRIYNVISLRLLICTGILLAGRCFNKTPDSRTVTRCQWQLIVKKPGGPSGKRVKTGPDTLQCAGHGGVSDIRAASGARRARVCPAHPVPPARSRLPPPRFPFRRAVPSPSGVSPAPFLLFPCGRRRLSGSGCRRRCRPRPGHRHRPRRAGRPQRREAAGAARGAAGAAGPGRPRRAGE